MNRTVRRRLLAAATTLYVSATAWAAGLEPWEFWLPSNPDGAAVDHAPWQGFLDRYLVELSDGSTRVRYDDVTAADRKALDGYLATLSGLDPRRLSRDAQLAYWINLYNAATVDLILDHYPIDSIRDVDDPWGRPVATVMGRALTLGDIEHGIVRAVFGDPRIHYALNCASIGCPNLAGAPYAAETLEVMLDAAARAYVNHPRGVQVTDGEVVVSKIYGWYREDFGAGEADVLDHIRAYADPPLLEALDGRDDIDSYAYDWSLNAPAAR